MSQTLCAGELSASTNLAYIQFQASALKIDSEPYFGEDIWLNAMYYDEDLGFTCSGRVQYDGGFPITMALVGKDVFVKNGFAENTEIILMAETFEGCILDSLQVFLANDETEDQPDSLYFSLNKVFEVQFIEAKTGDCLLTSLSNNSIITFSKFYPNPAFENIYFELEQAENTEIQYILTNPIGQVIKSGLVRGTSIQESINLSHLPPSIYYLTFRQNELVTTRKIVLTK